MAEKNDDKQTDVNQSLSNSDETTNSSSNEGISRRTFIKNTGLVAGGVVGGGVLGGVLGNQWFAGTDTETAGEAETDGESNNFQEARMFFSRDEDFNILNAAVERIFPEDENGPGAIALGVPYFIDKQLAGSWGLNAKEYMRGPFQEGEPEQGYQSRMRRNELFIVGLRRINEVSEEQWQEKFVDIEIEQQDEVLMAFDNGDVEMKGASSALFFSLLRNVTLEGVYSDPLYGGNRNMEGWRMKEYPGAQPAYINVIEDEEFIETEPLSLRDHH
ncbi:gluconate 2-dehydrogenase subunit 3 family protein [Salicibibacter cibi]|uniref:Gluconate 2-dehydrogenase subunit 3 family protein n=1 Tax=Salicibibacter cibi TaxID=2743001 RepID=A0A7T7CGE3_9BACI|nr:gluconate 2-dehydrogenase subunit 3 family protein [Salicibibacter cibi]QQK81093.1 gluconate 2-dehydrogenase subunit 3 family protein [Salicibibacter cibi]